MSAEAEPGDIVEVRTERGRPLGLAFFSSTSQITLRMLGEGPRDERALFSERLNAAIAYRGCEVAAVRRFGAGGLGALA